MSWLHDHEGDSIKFIYPIRLHFLELNDRYTIYVPILIGLYQSMIGTWCQQFIYFFFLITDHDLRWRNQKKKSLYEEFSKKLMMN